MDLDNGQPKFFPVASQYLYHISSLIDTSHYHSRHHHNAGSLALQETFTFISKFTDTVLFWRANGPKSNMIPKRRDFSVHINNVASNNNNHNHGLPRFFINYRRKALEIPELFNKFSRFAINQLLGKAKDLQFIPAISLAGNLVPPLAIENVNEIAGRSVNYGPCEIQQRRCGDFEGNINTVEPRTGIEFPTILDNIFGASNSSLNTEVLVGTGSKTMKIIKIKSLKLYAFGFYVHPYDVCNKLGSKYASLPENEVTKHHNFYKDLLREDISMTVRLVVSCNGIKISTVRDAFEKSLRTRLIKMNPDTDYDCVKSFGSLFSDDIQIRAGTTIKFQRTSDGHLVTEIEGNRIGAVHSRDLCRAFFDMYIGDGPVSEETKTEIGENVTNIIRRC
ncbi:fatty-acid-binding protein 2-like [Bidens hawaiensis]|uniref:fatty-acid-binding protein 2-like n=1 Tax=Bidens hawaiensis TaxID=980011 RepID=UPI0040492338